MKILLPSPRISSANLPRTSRSGAKQAKSANGPSLRHIETWRSYRRIMLPSTTCSEMGPQGFPGKLRGINLIFHSIFTVAQVSISASCHSESYYGLGYGLIEYM